MNDEMNPESGFQESPGVSPEALREALDRLIEAREGTTGSPPSPGNVDGSCGERDLPGAACPDPGDLAQLLSSDPAAVKSVKVNALLGHVAGCKVCAVRLRMLNADISLEEQALLDGLASSSAQGQQRMAAELARTPLRNPAKGFPSLYLWMGAGLAASLLIGVGLVSWWRLANNPERLMAEAYTHARIFDLRMPGSGFADVTPQQHLRGGANGRESSRLLEARAKIEEQLERTPEDGHWLQLEARADILEEKYDPAIDILDRLVAAGPANAGTLLDDASAYFQRGSATGSENDRATALDDLRRADELAPDDPVVLFNEALVMEDRGQFMNAVETWNRYLKFEQDAKWLAEGRRRLQALEQKLDQLKSHQGRMEQHLATPQAMRSLAADARTLGAIDEELSTSLLPGLLEKAFPGADPSPVAQSRGSPCADECMAARNLLYALAASLERNHQDSWLTKLLPPASLLSDSSLADPQFTQAAHALAQAIESSVHGDYPGAAEHAAGAERLFHALRKEPDAVKAMQGQAGEARAGVERADALQSMANYAGCYQAAHALVSSDDEFVGIEAEALALDAYCDPAPGSDVENNPSFVSAETLAHDRGYALVELRVRNMRGGAAVDAGDVEAAWRDYLTTIRQFYAGDYPALRLSGTLSSLEQVEQATPRKQLALLLQREHMGALQLTQNRQLLPTAWLNLAAVAIRAGSIDEAQRAMRSAQDELASNGGGKAVRATLAEVETALADVFLERGQADAAGKLLDSALEHMAGEKNAVYLRNYAVARGQLALEQGHPQVAEPVLREALLEQERLSSKGGAGTIVQAEQNRELYAELVGVWLAEGRSGEQALALWERYRLRILGVPVVACADKGLDCLKTKLEDVLRRPGFSLLVGQVVLPDRVLLYRAAAQGVVWTAAQVSREELMAAAGQLEQAVDSPETGMNAIHRVAQRVGSLLIDPIAQPDDLTAGGELVLEPDPLLGNLPWPSVEAATGGLGVRANLEESPSLLLERNEPHSVAAAGKALVVGASVASGESQLLPEVLAEARSVARFDSEPSLLLGDQATAAQVVERLATAETIHFAGHAASRGGATRLLLAPANEPGIPDTPWLDSETLRKHPPRRARLAVFSACSSGRNQASWDHGMGDIVSTLAAAGVPDVVATRWQIDSAAAVPMMDAFYGGLAKGLTVPRALTAARQAMVRDPRYHHPYYWAAWYASGSGTSDLSSIFHAGS